MLAYRVGRGLGIGVEGEWSQDCISYIQYLPYPSQCLEAGAHGRSGQRAPNPAGAKQGPALGPASALLPSMGVLHVLRRQGRREWNIKGRPALILLRAQV